MKYIDEFRSPKYVKILSQQIHEICKHNWKIMEVCGGQTHSIVKYGLNQLLPDNIELIHGPGCPVCVTPLEIIDSACNIALTPNAMLCTFGDMLRVPGTHKSLLTAKAEGGEVQVVYSPLDALQTAKKNPDKEVVFLAVGFETTAPANAMAVDLAKRSNVKNFSILVSHVRVPPAILALLQQDDCQLNGFLAAGNVCTIMGEDEYYSIAQDYQVPIVVTGFEPIDILCGVKACVSQLENKQHTVENQYQRSVRAKGNQTAQQTVEKVFQISDRNWRGLGVIPDGGLNLRDTYQAYDAVNKFPHKIITEAPESNLCQAGLVLQGKIKPKQCPHFGKKCTPERPLGAPMVSMEGACHAYYNYAYED